FNRRFNVTQCLPCLLKKAVSADDVLPYVPSRLSRDEHHLFPASNHDLGKPMRQAREKTIRIDVFLRHKSLAVESRRRPNEKEISLCRVSWQIRLLRSWCDSARRDQPT